MQRPSQKCPVCGGETMHKQVHKILRGGSDTAVVKAEADVCMRCGERLYDVETVLRFDEVRAKLERHETADFKPVGQAFEVN